MEIQIREARDTDVPALTGLLRSLGLFAHINAETAPSTEARVRRHLALCLSDDSHLILVAQSTGDELAGYCAVHWLPYLILAGPEGYVSELFVDERFRGQGIGRQLLEHCVTVAHGAGFVTVRNSNHFGMAGLWAEMAAAQGCIGMAFCNTRICAIPTFGRERILGTNPVCFAIPTTGKPCPPHSPGT